ncbi:uncharacterized protein PAC_11725 [Phialocephala subalpina]|uniref:Uncharacterized protein n=1 Tax=Phialocephala subalpina TaxID=576137 RepID=A0A1L7X9V7_9HELO|nr:uncharacterized protein PAC_11725 [Phialocephala subalpina]
MESSSGGSTPKRHSRHGSSGRALPRRSTRGPLDINESPISPSSGPTTPSTLTHNPSSLLSPTASQYATPRIPSPAIGSNLSNITSPSFRTARTTLSPSRSTLSTNSQKDFTFLLRPEIYHPLTLLDVPPPFRVASTQPDPSSPLEDLIAQGHLRSAAIKAAQLLTSPGLNTSDHEQIFNLIYTRLSCLTLCNQTTLASQEVKALEDLNSGYYRNDHDGTHLVPWELRVLAVRLQGMGFNDARRGIMGYYDLAREARLTLTGLKKKRKVGAEGDENGKLGDDIKMWETRLEELGIRVAGALIEMEDLEGATRFLATFKPSSDEKRQELEVRKALLWLCLGDVEAARKCISALSTNGEQDHERKVILALAHTADSDFDSAVEVWEELVASEGLEKGEMAMCKQNLGVCLLYLGKMDEARKILETLTDERNSFHALTFNLSTIYELCTERSRALKIGLAEKVAGMQEEDGKKVGWEKVNGDFKL